MKKWCFWTVVLEKTLESPLDCKEIQPVHSKDQSWMFIRRTDAEVETPILWPPHAKSWLIGKDSDAGRDWGQEEKGMTEDETAGWHHGLDGHDSEWTLGVGDGQGGLACCDSWGHKESDTTERTELNWITNWDTSKLGLSYRESWSISNSIIPKILTETWFYQGLSSIARSELQFSSLILISIPNTTFNWTFQPLLLKSTITPKERNSTECRDHH